MKEEIWNELYLYLIRFEIGVFKNFKECACSPCNGNHFSSIYMYVGRYVCLSWSKKRRRKYVGQTRACSKSVLCGKIRPVTPVIINFDYTL